MKGDTSHVQSLGDKKIKGVENVACFVGLKYDTQGTMPTFCVIRIMMLVV